MLTEHCPQRSDGGALSWNCEPMKYCDDRRSLAFCGEVLGGGSRINSMVYTRGRKADYDAWAEMGHSEWSYEKVLPFFVQGETSLNQPKSGYRSDSGMCYSKI
jgi:choline dehydrogenase